MRIAVAGTHGAGKSTLIEDFLARCPHYAHEPEPYEWLVELHGESFGDAPAADDFYRQLEICVERISSYKPGADVIAERSPLDFVAYLRAIGAAGTIINDAEELAGRGMAHVDLLVFVPLDGAIEIGDDEDLELREAMNEQLEEIVAQYEGWVVEVHGGREARVSALMKMLQT